ncbi:hypothetical protein niasHS_003437 [Heterodera schachtii]|uniref:Uncharacterized protein n=1 Tax=Heterodera schachtii TaxID=97005 RepID=A0ABD2KGN5_HETSC
MSSANSSSATASTSGPTNKRQRMRSECNVSNALVQKQSLGNSRHFANHRPRYRQPKRDNRRLLVPGLVSNCPARIRSAELSDLPGFSYDPTTKKYYRILENGPGRPPGSTLQHLRNLAVRAGNTETPSNSATSCFKPNRNSSVDVSNLPNYLQQLQLGPGGSSTTRRTGRFVEERRLRHVKQQPSYSFEVSGTWGQRFSSCQFLDVSEDGRTLIGCWTSEQNNLFEGHCSRVLSFGVTVDSTTANKDTQRMALAEDAGDMASLLDSNGKYRCNTYGLCFEPIDNEICLGSSNRILIDMVLAPADRDVTCLLFATARSFYQEQQHSVGSCPKIVTKCTVNLRPIEFNLSEEGRESMSSPIYNAHWTSTEPIWSLCFNSHHMKICVGMEKCAKILNVLSGQNFYVGSGGKNVISCIFSKDGNTLFLGRKNADVSMLDMRMTSNHKVGELAQSPSTGYMHLLQTRPHTLVTENFEGKIKLWDVRGRCQPLAELEIGHRNSSHKLPCFVDASERFVFAVGEDATVRGWSLHTGELLCSVTSPKTHQRNPLSYEQQLSMSTNDHPAISGVDFPRVAFSSSWGGRTGNSALILAVDGDLLVHELLL